MRWSELNATLASSFAIGANDAAQASAAGALVLDSHTGGEPTRLVLSGLDLAPGKVHAQAEALASKAWPRARGMVVEPRGHAGVVGAWVGAPADDAQLLRVIFFNNVGVLPMCVHGVIGVMASLAQSVGVPLGPHRLETPVGEVVATVHTPSEVSVRGVPSYRVRAGLRLHTADFGEVTGDLAWGGNWFFMAQDPQARIALDQVERLTRLSQQLRASLDASGLCGDDGRPIDHIHLSAPVLPGERGDARSFVLCPGGAWDRSPCGTGTSAKLACLAAEGVLAAGESWRQLGPVGSAFEASYGHATETGRVSTTVKGWAHLSARTQLYFADGDPFREGLPRAGASSDRATELEIGT